MIKPNIPIVEIKEINEMLTVTISNYLQEGIQSYLINKDFNYIVIKMTPHNEIELRYIMQIKDALASAGYLPTMLSVIDKTKEWTPYFIKIEWNTTIGEGN